MAATSTNKSSDQLVDILRLIQTRKTVRPEDATKALQQYRKVQEHIRELRTEIELFKTQKEEKDRQEALQKSQQQGHSPTLRRKSSVRGYNGVVSQPNTSRSVNSVSSTNGVPTTGSRSVNSVSSTNGVPTKGSRSVNSVSSTNGVPTTGSRLPIRSSASTLSDGKFTANNKNVKQIKQQEQQQQKQADDKASGKDVSTDKDKEIARLRLQNVQLKVIADNRALKRDTNSVQESEATPRGSILEQRNIPTTEQLVHDFKIMHESEYMSAFHDLENHYKLKEDDITGLLAGIAKEAYTFCQSSSKQQYEDITKAHTYVIDVLVQPKFTSTVTKDVLSSKTKSVIDKEGYQATRRYLKDYRRAMARVPIPGLIEIFESLVQRDVLSRLSSLRTIPKSTKPYIHRLIEINWFMSIQEPPMFQVWPRCGQLMSRDFVAYGKKGATIIHTVWPALFNQKEGTLAGRGVCLVK